MLIQSAPGKHRDREVAPTEKDVSDDKRLLILEILLTLEILLQTTENAGGHTSLPTTSGGAVANRAYRGFKCAVGNRAYRGLTVARGPVPRERLQQGEL